jgi:hypothetical protein
LPTFDRPRKAISGRLGTGNCAASVAAAINRERTLMLKFATPERNLASHNPPEPGLPRETQPATSLRFRFAASGRRERPTTVSPFDGRRERDMSRDTYQDDKQMKIMFGQGLRSTRTLPNSDPVFQEGKDKVPETPPLGNHV